MADNILWNQIQKRLQAILGDEAFAAWQSTYSPEIMHTDDNALTVRVTQHGEHISPIGKQVAKILDEMGFERTTVKFISTDDTIIVESKEGENLYEQIVNPDRALYLPGYFKRWVSQELGADYGMTVASYAQARYEAGGRSEGKMFTARITADKIAARAGCSTRTLRRRLVSEDFLRKTKGLLEFTKNTDWDFSSGTPHKLPSKVRVFTTMPLTPRDTAHLRHWIIENIESCGGPEGVLRAAAIAPVDELIGDDSESHVEDARTVLELVSLMFKGQIEQKLLIVLASNLHQRIIPSEDRIKITIFFMEHILPLIGAAQGWVLTWLRDRCYVDGTTHRNTVKVEQGWQELASSCGMNRAKTIYEWLNAKHPEGHPEAGKYINPILRLYVAEVLKDEPRLNFERQPRTFRVLMNEIPSEILEAVVTGEGIVADLMRPDICTLGLAELSTHPVWQKTVGGNVTIGMAEMSPSNGAVVTNGMAQLSTFVGAIVTVKALNSLKPTLNTYQPTPAESAPVETLSAVPASETENTGVGMSDNPPSPKSPLENQGGGDVEQPHLVENPDDFESVGQSVWFFSKLAKTSDINPTRVKYMTETVPNEQERTLRFVGWLLHAHSPKGKGLKDDTGVGLAISSIGSRPGNAFIRLAKLGPDKLRALFNSDFARTLGEQTAEEMIYRANLKKLPLHRKQDLYYRLFELDAPEPATATAKNNDAGPTGSADEAAKPKPASFDIPRRGIKVTA